MSRIAIIIYQLRSEYPYARSLASTLIETAHYETFFMLNLPSLTDFGLRPDGLPIDEGKLLIFMRPMLYSALDAPVL